MEVDYNAVVQEVVSDGKHGPYAVVRHLTLGRITFSLQPPVWTEKDWPEEGNVVVLSEIRKKRAGWRASFGRFFRPSDQQLSTPRKEREERK